MSRDGLIEFVKAAGVRGHALDTFSDMLDDALSVAFNDGIAAVAMSNE